MWYVNSKNKFSVISQPLSTLLTNALMTNPCDIHFCGIILSITHIKAFQKYIELNNNLLDQYVPRSF